MKDHSEKSVEPESEGLLRGPSVDLSPLVQMHTEDAAVFPPASLSKGKEKATPLPYMQVILVALFKGSQPMLFGVVMPYIPILLVSELKLANEVNVGHYAGMIEMATAVGQGLGVPVFARLSDKYGRRPVTLIGVFVACLTSCMFGFARSFPLLLFLRAMVGIANAASAATGKVMMAELTDQSNQATAFAMLGMGWQTHSVLAPLVGGIFSRPADTFSFLKGGIFETYPYALPTILAAIPPTLAMIAGIFYLEETHPVLKHGRQGVAARPGHIKSKRSDYAAVPTIGNLSMDEDEDTYDEKAISTTPANFITSLRARVVRFYHSLYETKDGIPGFLSSGLAFVLFLWFLLVVLILSLETSQLLLLFSSNPLGGLGLTKSGMSTFLALRPLLVCVYEINVFPRISKRFGYVAVYRTLICLPVITSLWYLLVSSAAINGLATSGWFIGGFLGLSLIVQCITNPVFLTIDILLPARTAHSSQLSAQNAVTEVVAQVAVATGAALGSSMFAWSAGLPEGSWFRGRAVWLGMLVVTGFTASVSQKLTHKDGWREREQVGQVEKHGDTHNA